MMRGGRLTKLIPALFARHFRSHFIVDISLWGDAMFRRRQRQSRNTNRNRIASQPIKQVGYSRSLGHERLEDRHMLTLLGISPVNMPTLGYDSGGTVNYNNVTDSYSISATPLSFK